MSWNLKSLCSSHARRKNVYGALSFVFAQDKKYYHASHSSDCNYTQALLLSSLITQGISPWTLLVELMLVFNSLHLIISYECLLKEDEYV